MNCFLCNMTRSALIDVISSALEQWSHFDMNESVKQGKRIYEKQWNKSRLQTVQTRIAKTSMVGITPPVTISALGLPAEAEIDPRPQIVETLARKLIVSVQVSTICDGSLHRMAHVQEATMIQGGDLG
jgi:hypothetical protein